MSAENVAESRGWRCDRITHRFELRHSGGWVVPHGGPQLQSEPVRSVMRQDVLPSIVKGRDEALSPEELEEVFERGPEPRTSTGIWNRSNPRSLASPFSPCTYASSSDEPCIWT